MLSSLSGEGRVVAGGIIVVDTLIAINASMLTTIIIYFLLTL